VLDLVYLVSEKSDIFKMIHSREHRFQRALFEPDVQLYLEDVSSHVTTLDQTLRRQNDMNEKAYLIYLAQVSVEQNWAANRMGITMKRVRCAFCFSWRSSLVSLCLCFVVYCWCLHLSTAHLYCRFAGCQHSGASGTSWAI